MDGHFGTGDWSMHESSGWLSNVYNRLNRQDWQLPFSAYDKLTAVMYYRRARCLITSLYSRQTLAHAVSSSMKPHIQRRLR